MQRRKDAISTGNLHLSRSAYFFLRFYIDDDFKSLKPGHFVHLILNALERFKAQNALEHFKYTE